METISEHSFENLEFTGESYTPDLQEPIPDLQKPLDLEVESQNLEVWQNQRGFQYHLPTGILARIMSWEDEDNPLDGGSGTTRLAVAESIDDNWPVYREPTLQEMIDFLRVAKHVMPDTPRTNVLEAQVAARLLLHAKNHAKQSEAFDSLAERIYFYRLNL